MLAERQPGVTLEQAVRATLPVRVLVADDDPEMRRLITVPLSRDGYQVTEVEDGAALLYFVGGLSASSRRYVIPPDVVILDLVMPKMDGIQALTALRKSSLALPIIIITAHGEAGIEDECIIRGATDVLGKPSDPERLRALIQRILNRPAPKETERATAQLASIPRGGRQ